MSDSLVRVSRRVEWGAHRPASGARRCRSTPEARAACHNRGDGVPRAYREPGLWPPPQSTLVHAPSRSADRLVAVPHTDRGASPAPIRFPPDNFKHSLTLFSKSFHLSLAVLVRYRSLARISLGRNSPPDLGCIPKQPDS
ncbi:hypothetical protein RDI58_035299 [Solanum bulbocastanum]|uniref:Uncharacterized protein n=1 Tax=Solanum bulbocastanum TaxID=147425 RepID=A0AAN8SFC2_SOLBU